MKQSPGEGNITLTQGWPTCGPRGRY